MDVWGWGAHKQVEWKENPVDKNKKYPVLGSVWRLQRCTLNKVKEMFSTFMQRGVYDDPAEQNRSKCSPHYVYPAAAAVSETRRSVPDNSQHPDERSKLPLARHLHHPSLSDESVPAATNGESYLRRWRDRKITTERGRPERLNVSISCFSNKTFAIALFAEWGRRGAERRGLDPHHPARV